MRFLADESPVFEDDNPVTRPCRRLWCAVLDRAYSDIRDAKIYGWNVYCSSAESRKSQQQILMDGAIEWFMGDSKEMPSFLWVCSALDFDPEYWRRRVRQEVGG